MCELFLTVGFDSHFHAYQKTKYDEKENNLIGCYIKDLSDLPDAYSSEGFV